MSKVKQKKHSTFIDMTAMSDVTVLLLTFFMSTATFLPKEPIMVQSPGSVMEIKIPDAYITTILIRPDGKTYVNFDRPNDREAILNKIAQDYNITFTKEQMNSFKNPTPIGIPINKEIMTQYLSSPMMQQDEYLKTHALSTDSARNELKQWLQYAISVAANEGKDYAKTYNIAVKADKGTPYIYVEPVISILQELHLNRFNLLTTLKTMPNILADN
ncbi:MAG: biopolymer transporter ExbD [Paludibacter sp.]|nr:biopolymer transporter ExbD [Paludibacter sp.]